MRVNVPDGHEWVVCNALLLLAEHYQRLGDRVEASRGGDRAATARQHRLEANDILRLALLFSPSREWTDCLNSHVKNVT